MHIRIITRRHINNFICADTAFQIWIAITQRLVMSFIILILLLIVSRHKSFYSSDLNKFSNSTARISKALSKKSRIYLCVYLLVELGACTCGSLGTPRRSLTCTRNNIVTEINVIALIAQVNLMKSVSIFW
jgi:hypothetical protein